MDSKIFAFVFVSAMRDATLQLSYKGEKSWLTDCNKFPNSTSALKAFVEDVIKGHFSSQDAYDKRFIVVADLFCKEINAIAKNQEFTFGNAQKLINIMMKFFYLHTYGNEREKEFFQYCHCPMDQQLIEAVWTNRNKLSYKTQVLLGKRADFITAWGNEEFFNNGQLWYSPRYIAFQTAVKELASTVKVNGRTIYPIEYDFFLWNAKKSTNIK